MKIKSGGIISGQTIVSTLGEVCRDNRLVYVLDGEIKADELEFCRGESFLIAKNKGADIEVKDGAKCAWFGIALGVGESIALENPSAVSDESKAEQLVSLLCPNLEWQSFNEAYDEAAAKMLLALLAPENGALDAVGNTHVDMAKRYICENYGKPIKVEDIAESLGVDRKYLRNLFFRYLGVSTKDYLTEYRIEKAKEMLSQNSVAVNEIAAAVGYPDALGFSKIFKKHVGVSPSEYRSGTFTAEPAENTEKAIDKKQEEAPKPKKEDIKYFLL